MLHLARIHFPDSRKKYWTFFKIAVPVIIGSFLFSLNNFVDNFMVTNINGGVAALSIANSWGAALFAVVAGINFIATPVFAQFYGSGKLKQARDTAKFRMIAALVLGIGFATSAWIFPEKMLYLFSPNEDKKVIEISKQYLKIITITWMLAMISFTYSSLLRELGFGFLQMFTTILVLSVNIIFNAIFIYALNLGVIGAAWASVISRVVSSTCNFLILWKKERKIVFSFFRIFIIDKAIWSLMYKRLFGAILIAISQITINVRGVLWNYGFPAGSIGDSSFNISAASIIGITGSITAVFLSGIFSIDATNSIFVSQELGRNNIEAARENSRQLKGFNALLGFFFSIGLVVIIFAFPYMTFLTKGQYDFQLKSGGIEKATAVSQQLLKEMQLTLVPVAILLPVWLWYVTSAVSIRTGHKNLRSSYLDFILNTMQFLFLLIVNLGIAPYLNGNLWIAVFFFYFSDILKMVPYEYAYYRWNWSSNIVKNQVKTL